MNNIKILARHIAEILKGKPQITDNYITVSRSKKLTVTIDGRHTKSSVHSGFSFESQDNEGKTLNLGEVVLLQEEIALFMRALINKNITISALHNHWIYDDPKLYYLHFQSIDYPVEFARHVEHAFRSIEPDKRSKHINHPIIKIR